MLLKTMFTRLIAFQSQVNDITSYNILCENSEKSSGLILYGICIWTEAVTGYVWTALEVTCRIADKAFQKFNFFCPLYLFELLLRRSGCENISGPSRNGPQGWVVQSLVNSWINENFDITVVLFRRGFLFIPCVLDC